MDQLLIQRSRYVLRSRVRRVQACPPALFISSCNQLINWIQNHPILSAVANNLNLVPGEHKEMIKKILNEANGKSAYDPGFYSAKTSVEHAAVCFEIVKAIASLDTLKSSDQQLFLLRNFSEYLTKKDYLKWDEVLEVLRDVAVDGLFEYIDERIDTRNALYGMFLKYKQRSEWFHRSRLRNIAKKGYEGKMGERILALDLQEYIFDKGVEFIVEPVSASGEVDLILRDSDGRYIVIDAKYIPEDAPRSLIKEKLATGFNQVSFYCNDYNEPEGFLVCFSSTDKKINIELEESDGFRFLKLGGKTVYFIQVEIGNLPSASRAGKASGVSIKMNELFIKRA